MNEEQYYNKEDNYTDEQIEAIDFGEECGLVFQNEIDDNERPVFLGTDKEMELYEMGELVR